MSSYYALSIADPTREANRKDIDQQLYAKIHCDQCGDLIERDCVFPLERQEQQGGEVIDDGLHNITDTAGAQRMIIIRSYTHEAYFSFY